MRFALTHASLCLIYFAVAFRSRHNAGQRRRRSDSSRDGLTDQRVTEVGQATFEQPIQLPALASPRLRSRADEAAD